MLRYLQTSCEMAIMSAGMWEGMGTCTQTSNNTTQTSKYKYTKTVVEKRKKENSNETYGNSSLSSLYGTQVTKC